MRHPSRSVVLGPRAPALVVLAITLTAGACGGGGYSSPSVPSTPATTQPAAAVLTVTINAAGVDPQKLQVPLGGAVAFVNNDTRAHQIMSDPHPQHGDCPAINEVSMLAPGQSRQTGALTLARACGYHDHMNPGAGALQGTLLVGGAQDPGPHY